MTPEQQCIAIAEWCGWVEIMDRGVAFGAHVLTGRIKVEGGLELKTLPDYLNDLNAMHDAESKFTEQSAQDAYCLALANVCSGCVDWDSERMNVVAWVTMRATASQRAEALLRTIGKWQDESTKAKQ